LEVIWLPVTTQCQFQRGVVVACCTECLLVFDHKVGMSYANIYNLVSLHNAPKYSHQYTALIYFTITA